MHGDVPVVKVGSGVDIIRSRAKVYCNILLTLENSDAPERAGAAALQRHLAVALPFTRGSDFHN